LKTKAPEKNGWRLLLPLAALIVLVVAVAYTPVLHAGFVFDDPFLITDNPLIKAGDGLYRFWFTTQAPDYYPLTWSLWWAEWRLWGGNPMGYHVVNVLLHAADAVLIWVVLRRLRIPGAWLAALIFGIHPVNVATVAWVSEQKNTLSMFFYLIAILLYLRFDEDGSWRWHRASLAAFLLALFSKTAVVMLPVVLLGCVWWVHGRVRWKDVLRSGPFFAASLAMALVTIWFQSHRAVQGHVIRTVSFAFRLAAAGWVPWFYLGKALLPVDLTVIYPKWQIDASQWASYLPGAIIIGSLAVFWRKRNTWGRALLFGWGYFVVMLFPVLGFFDQALYRASLVADHWQYYSIIGIIALAVAGAASICHRLGETGRRFGVGAGAALLILLGGATWQRAQLYANEEALWGDNLAKNPDAWLAHDNYGNALQRRGRLAEAREHFEQALRLRPDFPEAYNDLGTNFGEEGRYEEAIAQFEQALRIRPVFAEAQYNLGNAFINLHKPADALTHYKLALQFKPDYPDAQHNMGVALAQLGRAAESVGYFEEFLRANPNDAPGRHDLGLALLQAGQYPEAIRQFEQALRIDPDYAEVHYDLGIALEKSGRYPEAIEHYQQALRIRPDYQEAQDRLNRLRAVR
jgi:tetratricopeptide (TPR) repeat protein